MQLNAKDPLHNNNIEIISRIGLSNSSPQAASTLQQHVLQKYTGASEDIVWLLQLKLRALQHRSCCNLAGTGVKALKQKQKQVRADCVAPHICLLFPFGVVSVVQSAFTHTRAQTYRKLPCLVLSQVPSTLWQCHSAKTGGKEAGLTCTSKSGPVGACMVPSTNVKEPSIELLLCKL